MITAAISMGRNSFSFFCLPLSCECVRGTKHYIPCFGRGEERNRKVAFSVLRETRREKKKKKKEQQKDELRNPLEKGVEIEKFFSSSRLACSREKCQSSGGHRERKRVICATDYFGLEGDEVAFIEGPCPRFLS